MKKLSTTLTRASQLLLAAGLLAAGPAAAQTQPTVVYALGTVTNGFMYQGISYPTGSQTLAALDPTTAMPPATSTGLASPGVGYPITGITTGSNQTIVGIDYRPATGDLYALGFNPNAAAGSTNAQLYILSINSTTNTAVLTAVGGPIRLNLADNIRNNTRGVIPNIGFDFNPRADRIRVVAPNGADYRLNPNNGTITATDGTLFYASGAVTPPNATPYVGTAAYTNSRLGLRSTTLYDIDVTANNATLSTQNPPNNGQLNPVANVTFFLPKDPSGNTGPYQITSPTVGLGLDVYGASTAYLIEARLADNSLPATTPPSATTTYTSNFYTFNLSTGRATLVNNIVGRVTLFYSDIAAPIALVKTWTGQVNTAWENDNNWYPVGAPLSTDDVVIPGNNSFVRAANVTVTNQPTVNPTAQGVTDQAASVNLINGAVLTIADNGTLNVNGDIVNNDSQIQGSGSASNSGIVALVGSTQQDIGGNVTTNFPNLSVNNGQNGVSTSTDVSIVRSVTVANATTLTIGSSQAFTLLSSSAGTAYLVNNGSGTVSGTATVQRYIFPSLNGGAGYRHYSTPVSGNTVADFATSGFSPTVNAAYNTSTNPRQVQPYPTVFTYDQSRLASSNASYTVGDFDNGFLSPNSTGDALATETGYTVNINASQLVDFMGTLNQNSSYSRTNLTRGAQTSAGYQFLGNPYPTAVNFDQFTTSNMESALYVYKSSGQYAGSYTTYVNGLGTNSGTNNIPVAQGFFMRTAAGATGSVTIPTTARTNSPETAQFQRTAATTLPTLALTLRNASSANQLRVYFEQGATAGFDAAFDAHYLPATTGLDLASDLGTEALAINGLPALAGTTVTVPLRLHAATAGTYTLAVDELLNLPAGYRAYLLDASTGTTTDLSATPTLPLTLAPSDAAVGRYAVVFGTAAPLASAPAALASLVALYPNPNPAHGTAVLVLPTTLRGQAASEVQVLNTLGQVVLRRSVAAGGSDQVALPLEGLAAGVYTVRASTSSGTVVRQLVVE